MKPLKSIITVFVLLLLTVSAMAEKQEFQYADVLAPDTWIGSMGVSHDGETLAVSTQSGIWLLPAGEGEPVKILSNMEYPSEYVSLCQFSADDSELWYSRIYDGKYRLEYINIASGEHNVFADNAILAKWSRDGSYVYYYRLDLDYESYFDGLFAYTLVRYDTATGTVKNIIPAEEMTLSSRTPAYSVSNDGSYITGPYNQTYIVGVVPTHNMYRYNPDGTKQQLTFFNYGGIEESEHSPDGQYILYKHEYYTGSQDDPVFISALLVYHIASGKHYIVADWQEDLRISSIAWSHDGSQILYVPGVSTDIHAIDFRPDELVKLTSFEIDAEKPDNTVLVFEGEEYDQYNEDIRSTTSVDIPASGRIDISTKWIDSNPDSHQEDAFDWYLERGQQYPVFSPDGSRIVFTDGTQCGIWSLSLEDETVDLVYINAQRTKSEANNIDTYSRGYSKEPLGFSPEGEVIFREYIFDEEWGSNFFKDDEGNIKGTAHYVPTINSVNLETHEATLLVMGAYEATFMPNGSKIVYAGLNKERDINDLYTYEAGIFVRDIATGEERKLTDSGRMPAVSPDGSTVYYCARVDGSSQIFRVPVAGGVPVQMTSSLTWYDPTISPDGKWLMCRVVDGPVGGRDQWLRAINLDTGLDYDFVPPYDYVRASECSFSPDGRKICYALLEKYGSDDVGRLFKHIYTAEFDPDIFLKPTAVDKDIPVDFAVTSVYPNPFNMSATIEYVLPEEGFVTLTIYNVMGQKIRELLSGNMLSGAHSINWDGRYRNGMSVSSGIYFSHLKLGDKVATKRMMLLK